MCVCVCALLPKGVQSWIGLLKMMVMKPLIFNMLSLVLKPGYDQIHPHYPALREQRLVQGSLSITENVLLRTTKGGCCCLGARGASQLRFLCGQQQRHYTLGPDTFRSPEFRVLGETLFVLRLNHTTVALFFDEGR